MISVVSRTAVLFSANKLWAWAEPLQSWCQMIPWSHERFSNTVLSVYLRKELERLVL